jgi:hypothetical protein
MATYEVVMRGILALDTEELETKGVEQTLPWRRRWAIDRLAEPT